MQSEKEKKVVNLAIEKRKTNILNGDRCLFDGPII